MADRYILIADRDEGFFERVGKLLSPDGYRIVATNSDDEALEALARHRPKLVFIAVELPAKEGFSLFSKVKKAQRNVPVVLTTSSVSAADLKLHEKLRIHADVYLDKRSLEDEALKEVLAARLGVDFVSPEPVPVPSNDPVESHEPDDPDERVQLDDESAGDETREAPDLEDDVSDDSPDESNDVAAPRRIPDVDPVLSEFLDPETAAVFAEIDEEASAVMNPAATKPGDVTPERLAELEALAKRLEDELGQARRDARSSPFSSEFLSARELASQKDEEIRSLTEALSRRDGYVLVVKRKLAEMARKLVETGNDLAQRTEDVTELRERLLTANKKLEQLAADAEEQSRLHDREIESLKHALSEEQVRVTVTRHELEGQLAELRAEQSRIVHEHEQARVKAQKELEALLKQERAEALTELREKYSGKLKEIEETRGRTLSEMRAEHERELAALHESHREAMERATVEARDTLREASEKSAEALKQSNDQRVAELRQAEEKRSTDLAAAEVRHNARIEALIGKHAAEREELEARANAAVKTNETMLEEVNAKVEDVLRSWEKERKAHHETREQYEKNLAELAAEHTKHLERAEQDQFTVLTGLSRKFRDERAKALEAERARGEEKLQELAKEHAAALESREKRHEEMVERLRADQEHRLAQKDLEFEQAVRDAVERATAELSDQHAEDRRSHANQLASLRQSKEKDIAALQAAHMEALAKRDREAQQALREAVDHVKADTSEQIDQLTDEHAEALATLRKEYEEELVTLEEAHRAVVTQQETAARETIRGVEDERDEARVTIDALRAEIAEMAASHRSSTTILEERHKAELRDLQKELKTKLAQIDEEKQFLAASVEKLKRQSTAELRRITDALAHEKQLHQATRERYERRVSELKGRHNSGIKRVEQDWMQKLEALEKTLTERGESSVAQAEKDWQAKLERLRLQHEDSVASMQKEFEMEMAAARQHLERAKSFEESYQGASRQLTALQTEAEELRLELDEAQRQIREKDDLIARHAKKVSDNKETIDSLKAVINDFSRSVDGYLQDRDDQDQTISSLKAVIDDMYRSIEEKSDQN